MKKLYTFTSDDIHTTIDYANGERNTINLEDAELLPDGARVLTRGEVGQFCFKFGLSVNDAMLDELFGESP